MSYFCGVLLSVDRLFSLFFPLFVRSDCDDDSECVGDLVCMQRDGNEDVPGCGGENVGWRDGVDFCIRRYNDGEIMSLPPPLELFSLPEEDMSPGTPFLERVGDNNVSNLPRCKGKL